MKVILLSDIKNLGKKNQIIEVSTGYASNYLIPRKLAVAFTSKSVEILANQKANEAQQEEKNKQQSLDVRNQLESIVLEFKAKAAPDGRMVGTISYKQIEEALKIQHNIIIDKRKFIDKYQINAFGTTKLKIELYKDIVGVVSVHVSEDK